MRPDATSDRLVDGVRRIARPLAADDDLEPLLDLVGDARFVLLGEATHGTSEFYTWRARLTQRLIAERGFSFVGVEGDWPDCYRVNRWVKGRLDGSADDVLHAFDRWPTWMWANREVAAFAAWLRDVNGRRPAEEMAGFYGLDVYSLWDSMRGVVEYLDRIDPEAARSARRAYACFDPYHDDEHEYARATALVPTSCEDEAVTMLRTLRTRAPEYQEDGRDAFFDAEQNALVARNAERYYRTMIRGGPTSWNVRDHHMVETLERLVAFHDDALGAGRSKAVVWEHNTHIGDARFTDMRRSGMINVGQVVRELHGERPHERDGVALIGFGTHRGSVMAGDEWGAPMRPMRVPEARAGSWEDVLHRAGDGRDLLLVFGDADDGGVPGLEAPIDHRAIGVVYDPRRERWGNYVPTIVPRRYDAFVFVDESRALDALHLAERHDHGEVAETYPWGM